ncbi:MAG TPA: DUF2892 domain-containing protein [Pelomicrobium sp.]|nr:DUF2892 domain-containing protein [Pelomicrobium sp.]
MKRNVAGVDRVARIGAGVVLFALAFFLLPAGLNTAAYLVGLNALGTGLAAYCPIRDALRTRSAADDAGRAAH